MLNESLIHMLVLSSYSGISQGILWNKFPKCSQVLVLQTPMPWFSQCYKAIAPKLQNLGIDIGTGIQSSGW